MDKRKLEELIDINDSAIDLLQQWVRDAEVQCELLPHGPERDNTLHYLQVIK